MQDTPVRPLSRDGAARSIEAMATRTPAVEEDPATCGTGRRPHDFHPLEFIAFFRRFKPSLPRDLLYTLIWNCALAVVFMTIGFLLEPRAISWTTAWRVLWISNCIGFTIHLFFSIGGLLGLDKRIHRRGGVIVAAYYTLIATAGVVLGFAISGQLADLPVAKWFTNPRWLAAIALNSLIISVLISAAFFARERSLRAKAEIERQQQRLERIEREALTANLRTLQAQIEPHFLFNTLANVASLVDPDPGKAKYMLECFIRFLRASLAATRAEATTLGADAELIRAYLEVIKVRMGARLAFTIDLEPGLAAFALPPMLLQPIVENAVRHGLEPKVSGGELRWSAHREEGSVVVEISDTGVGFAPTTTGGMGLTNVRDRLRLLYGDRGALTIRENGTAGTVVSMRIPA